ncbi:MAG: universal stress protein [Thermodesulfobacteriota bacterium]
MVVATDGSACSQAAVNEALSLAAGCKGRLTVLSVVEINAESAALAPQWMAKMEAEAEQHLSAVKAQAAGAGVECETVLVRSDEPYRAIVDEASQRKADLVIMGSHGRSGLSRLLMGSVTARVVGHAPCKVLIVPHAGA